MTDSYDTLHRHAVAALRRGDTKAAVFFFDKVWLYPGMVAAETRWHESLTLFAQVQTAHSDSPRASQK